MNAIKTIAAAAIMTAAVATVNAQDSRPFTGVAIPNEVVAEGVLFNSTGGAATGDIITGSILGNIVLDTKGTGLYSFGVDKVTFEFYTPEGSAGNVYSWFAKTQVTDVEGRGYYAPSAEIITDSFTTFGVSKGTDSVSSVAIAYDTPVELSYGLSYDISKTGEYFAGGFAFLVGSDIDGFGMNLATSDSIETVPFADTYNTAWTKDADGAFVGKDLEAPFTIKIEGNATQIGVVPEAGTVTLALMGFAALGGFAGLRRFKRN